MQQSQTRKKLYIAGGVGIVGILILVSVFHKQPAKPTITIAATPLSATVSINGKRGVVGTNIVQSGSIEIVVSHKGFATQTRIATVQRNATNYAGFILASNSQATANWYSEHSADQQASSSIASKQSDISATESIQNVPIIQILPYLGPGLEYRVDYGVNPSPTAVQTPAIYINALTPKARADALHWIKSRGYDLATMKIVFTSDPTTL